MTTILSFNSFNVSVVWVAHITYWTNSEFTETWSYFMISFRTKNNSSYKICSCCAVLHLTCQNKHHLLLLAVYSIVNILRIVCTCVRKRVSELKPTEKLHKNEEVGGEEGEALRGALTTRCSLLLQGQSHVNWRELPRYRMSAIPGFEIKTPGAKTTFFHKQHIHP